MSLISRYKTERSSLLLRYSRGYDSSFIGVATAGTGCPPINWVSKKQPTDSTVETRVFGAEFVAWLKQGNKILRGIRYIHPCYGRPSIVLIQHGHDFDKLRFILAS
jgi:hypothetical protein